MSCARNECSQCPFAIHTAAAHRTASSHRAATSGFTIVEMLAALLVIAIGIVGIAALYGDALQTESETEPRIQAAGWRE